MKINKLHPYLPQETGGPVVLHPHLEQEIKQAKKLVRRLEKDLVFLWKKYLKLEAKYHGPFTVEMIEVTAKLKRARRECTMAKQNLHRLVLVKGDRKRREKKD